MQKYIFMMIFLGSSVFAGQKDIQGVDEIERIVLAFLEPASSATSVLQKSQKGEGSKNMEKGSFYIQMGAFSRQKPFSLIDQLKQSGYQVLLKPTLRHKQKLNLVLVGPYRNRADVQKHLKDLRTAVPTAFVYKEK